MTIQCSVFCAMSLDGYIARKDNALDWLMGSDPNAEGPPPDSGFDAFMESVDYVVLGRNTFDVVVKMTTDRWFYSKPVYVLTRRPLGQIPDLAKGKVESGAHAPSELVALMEKRGAKRLYIDGGKTIQSFLRAGLIDDLTIGHIPVLIGEGIPLFGSLSKDVKLTILSSRIQMNGGAVQTTYRVVKPADGKR
jgi:dihydrofolate reductase